MLNFVKCKLSSLDGISRAEHVGSFTKIIILQATKCILQSKQGMSILKKIEYQKWVVVNLMQY